MTAKHRRGKGTQKNEDNFLKPEILESEVRNDRKNNNNNNTNNTYSLVLLLVVVIGGLFGVWICLQQNQTLTELTDSVLGLQVKMVQLQSSHEEEKQFSDELRTSQSLDARLTALEEFCAAGQKQVNMALAASGQSKVSDLSTQVLSLHSEMAARLAEMQKHKESLDQLQDVLRENSEDMEDIRVQVEGLTALSSELSRHVEVLTVSQGEVETRLEEEASQVAALSATVDGQTAEGIWVREQLDSFQAQLEATALEVTSVREDLEQEHSQQHQQKDVEEQMNAVHQNLQDQKSEVQKFHVEVGAELEHIQRQILQLMAKPRVVEEPKEDAEEAEGEEEVETLEEKEEERKDEETRNDTHIQAEEEDEEDEDDDEAEDVPESQLELVEATEPNEEEEVEEEEEVVEEDEEDEEEKAEGAETKEESMDEEKEDEKETVEEPETVEETNRVQDEIINQGEKEEVLEKSDEDTESVEWNDEDKDDDDDDEEEEEH